MRILLDEHISQRKVGTALRALGHDVRAVAEDPVLAGLDDPSILAIAAEEGWLLVTFNHRDFAPLLRERSEAGGKHAGCIIVYGIQHGEIGLIVRGLERLLASRPAQEDWTDITVALNRGEQ